MLCGPSLSKDSHRDPGAAEETGPVSHLSGDLLRSQGPDLCFHAYCRECIQQLLLQQQRDQEVECPQCHSVVPVAGNDPSSLPTVFFINRLIEECRILKKAESNEITCQSCSSVVKATSFCHTCSMFICASCSDAHEKMKVFKGHKAVPVSEMSEETSIQLSTPTPPCQKHEGELNLYCLKCEQLICRDCTLVEHAGHNFNFVKGVAVAYKEEILSTLVPLRDTHANVTTDHLQAWRRPRKRSGTRGRTLLQPSLNHSKSFMLFSTIVSKFCYRRQRRWWGGRWVY